MDKIEKSGSTYQGLVNQISERYEQGRRAAVIAVNSHLIETYWNVGRDIVEFEQNGSDRATYGTRLLENLSKDLTVRHGKGFSMSNLSRMRQFYSVYPILAELPQEFSWTHIVELLSISDPMERSFYERQSVIERWSTTELIRQKKSSLFLRLAASKDKDGILQLARQGQIIEKPEDIIREPYSLDFLQVPQPYQVSESELETRIISKLQQFLLELGRGFTFVGRQYRIVLGNRPYYVDLVFYHRILRCFVLIDLKKERAGYADVGQMNMYLGYFENEENIEGDNPPIGIVLAMEKDEWEVKYAMHNNNSNLFVSQYQLYLPDREELKALVERQLSEDER
ncbi:MAG: PDDEXK nuclease domain-containing protein [Tannerellaceae bacterium]|nr:PDDEXK nuclease domain-containing protein [Tannerellaceae bacterium]